LPGEYGRAKDQIGGSEGVVKHPVSLLPGQCGRD
jgi:hypothetical protein